MARRRWAGIAAGALANQTGAVVGLSNVFTTTLELSAVYADLPPAIWDLLGPMPIVGYAPADALPVALGPWLRSDQSAARLAQAAAPQSPVHR